MVRRDRGEASRTSVERLLFDRPLLYRLKRFVIERVLWDWLFARLLRFEPRPMPDALPELEGRRVLLAGCGPGNATTGPSVESAAEVIAFDLSLQFATACARNRPDWRVYCGDLLRLSHADDQFDVSVLYSTLHHVPVGAAEVLAELARVSRERIVVLEGVVPERGLLRLALLLWYRLVDGGHHYYTLTELRGIVEGLGLEIVSEERYGPIQHMWLATLGHRSATR